MTALGRIGRLFVPAGTPDGYIPTVDSERLVYAAPPSGGGGGWDNPVTLPLSTLTGWTAGAGTWSITSGVIRQANTANAVYRLHLNQLVPLAEVIAEVDVKMDTTPNNVSSRGGFVFGTPRASDAANGHLIALLTSGSTTHATAVNFEQDATLAYGSVALASNIINGTWIRFRVHKVGNHYSVWIDGTYLCSFQMGINAAGASSGREFGRMALYSYASDASFRNLDIWTPTQP